MNFRNPYDIICTVPVNLIDAVNQCMAQIADQDFYTYKDFDVSTKELSWLRVDFMTKPKNHALVPLYDSIMAVVDYIKTNAKIKQVNSVCISLIKAHQVLAEHTDGRFIHRITDRYLVPLTASTRNYIYWLHNNEKVEHVLQLGQVIRVNNAIIHSALNLEDQDRYTILIDTFDARLKEKFKHHPDLFKGLTVLGVNYEFEKRRPVLKPQQ